MKFKERKNVLIRCIKLELKTVTRDIFPLIASLADPHNFFLNIKPFFMLVFSRLDIPHCKMEKLYYKPLSKLITRFVKQFKMSMEEICPNLARKKKRGVLFFLINKRYIETPDQNQNLSKCVKNSS